MRTSRSTRALLAAVAALGGFLSFANAQSVATTPVGAVSVTVSPGTGTSRALTTVSFPLLDLGVATGAMSGQITSFTSNTITNSGAAWGAGELSAAAAPYVLTVTSGQAVGRYFLISSTAANTSTTVTVDAEEAALVDLTAIGLQAGDTYAIVRCDTLGSLFADAASLGVIGGTNASGAGADIIQIQVAGAWRQYYYNTTSSTWRRLTLNTDSTNVVLKPDALLLYNRIGATPLTITLTGSVPSTNRKILAKNSGLTPAANPWPSGSLTLANSGIADMPGWVKNASSSVADIVQLQVSGAWRQYYHDGVSWKRVTLNTQSDSVVIPSASGVLLNKKGAASGAAVINSPMPYTL